VSRAAWQPAGTPNAVGRVIADTYRNTGGTWAEVAQRFGTTPEMARKLANGQGKFGAAGAGRSLERNARQYEATGRPQPAVQRPQAVRVKGGGTAPAAPRTEAVRARWQQVTRQDFRRPNGRTGTETAVKFPRSRTKSGADRESGRHAVNDALRSAARGRRNVGLVVTVKDGHGGTFTVQQYGGRDDAGRSISASRLLAMSRAEGFDILQVIVDNGLDRYGRRQGEDVHELDVVSVEVITY